MQHGQKSRLLATPDEANGPREFDVRRIRG